MVFRRGGWGGPPSVNADSNKSCLEACKVARPATSRRTRTFQESQSEAPLPPKEHELPSRPAGTWPPTSAGFSEAGRFSGCETGGIDSWRREGSAPTHPHPRLPLPSPPPPRGGPGPEIFDSLRLQAVPSSSRGMETINAARTPPLSMLWDACAGSSRYCTLFSRNQKVGTFTQRFFTGLRRPLA